MQQRQAEFEREQAPRPETSSLMSMLRRTENNINHIVERGQRELEERQRNRMYGEFKENFPMNESDTSLSEMSKGFDSMAIQQHYQVKNQLEEYK